MAENQEFMLAQPEEIVLSSDIENPDKYLDDLIKGTQGDESAQSQLTAIRLLDHKEKVNWLLSLSDSSAGKEPRKPGELLPAVPPAVVCALVTVTVVVMVVVGYKIVNGVKTAIKKREERQKQVEKCVPRRK